MINMELDDAPSIVTARFMEKMSVMVGSVAVTFDTKTHNDKFLASLNAMLNPVGAKVRRAC